ELVDMPETTAKMIHQNARWYKGVLDDVPFLWATWRAHRSPFNLAQLCRHVGNKAIEWPIAAVVYPLLGFVGWHLAHRFAYHPVWFVLGVALPDTPVTQNSPSCSFNVIVAGPRVSLSPTFRPTSATVMPVTFSPSRTVERPRNGSTRVTSDFCAAGSSSNTLSPTFTVTCTAATLFSSSHF